MYVLTAEQAAGMRYGFELEQLAEEVIDVDRTDRFEQELLG
jgi:hypothetical protein